MISKISFEIDFPLDVLEKSKKLNFENEETREDILKRNVYCYKYGRERNPILKERSETYLSLSKEVLNLINKNYPSLDVVNLSIFGSALFSNNPGDFDFLAITHGNVFLLDEMKLNLEETLSNGMKKPTEYSVGISIKGLENFTQGISNPSSKVSLNYQNQIIYRTASSLFRRHVPILGYDFINNEKVFSENIYAQASDLLNNTYELYYLKNKKIDLDAKQRSRKILSRLYEAVSYLEFLEKDEGIINLRKEIYSSIDNQLSFLQSKKLFNKVVSVYESRIKQKRSKDDQ